MKSRFALFVLVLLLLTATVCAAQSPMYFSPTTFYEAFNTLNTALEGPKCVYSKGSQEGEAYVVSSDSLGILMEYSDDRVTELYLYFNYLSDDEDASNDTVGMTFATLATFWFASQIQSGVDIRNMDTEELEDMVSEVMYVYLLLSMSSEPQDYWGYRFAMSTREENGYKEGVLYITKAD